MWLNLYCSHSSSFFPLTWLWWFQVQSFFAALKALSRKEIHYGAYATSEQVVWISFPSFQATGWPEFLVYYLQVQHFSRQINILFHSYYQIHFNYWYDWTLQMKSIVQQMKWIKKKRAVQKKWSYKELFLKQNLDCEISNLFLKTYGKFVWLAFLIYRTCCIKSMSWFYL